MVPPSDPIQCPGWHSAVSKRAVETLLRDAIAAWFDVYQAMKDDPTLIGLDDLHPTPRGYDVMAGAFFEGIRTHFENRPAAAGSAR